MAYKTRKQLKAEIERLKSQNLTNLREGRDTLARLAMHFGIGEEYAVVHAFDYYDGVSRWEIEDDALRHDLLTIAHTRTIEESLYRLTPRAPGTEDEED